MNAPRVVAIDGAAGSGKSTLARSLARALGLPYVNTGLMYRALAAAALRRGVQPGDESNVLGPMRRLRFNLVAGSPDELEVEGYGLDELMSVEVESTVSAVAGHASVRAHMRRQQRRLGETHGAVMEGRDIASVVFADAPVKLYLRAPSRLRAERRAEERETRSVGEVANALAARDARDARTNPHEPARGAIVLDTSDLDPAQTLEAALAVVRERAPELVP